MKNSIIYRSLIMTAIGMTLSMNSVALVYDESIDGRLSNDSSAPTVINFDSAINIIRGAADAPIQGDGDFFTFTLEPGETLTSINLNDYRVDFAEGFDSVNSFFGIGDAANGFPVTTNRGRGLLPRDLNTPLLTGSLFGEDNVAVPGEDPFNLLSLSNRSSVDEEGTNLTFEDGFNGTLGAGTYWVWISETADSIQYDFEFNIDGLVVTPDPAPVPLPASILLLAGPLVMLTRMKKKRPVTA